MSSSVLVGIINETIDFVTNYQLDEKKQQDDDKLLSMDALLQKYYTLNNIPLNLLSPIHKDYKSPYNAIRDKALHGLWRNMKDTLELKLKLRHKDYLENENKANKYDEELNEKTVELSNGIDELWKAEITDGNQSADILCQQYIIFAHEFGNIETMQLIRRLNSCNDMGTIMSEYNYFNHGINDTLYAIKQAITRKHQTIVQQSYRLRPRKRLPSLANEGFLFHESNQLIAIAAVRDYDNQYQLNIPDGIRLMIRMYYQGLTFRDKIIQLISNTLHSMDDLPYEVDEFEQFYLSLYLIEDRPTDFYKVFQTEITAIYQRFGTKTLNEYLSKAEENPSNALTTYSTKLQNFYVSRCQNQNSQYLELTYNEKILRLFVDAISTKYNDGYDNMIFDIDNGYEDLTSDLKGDISRIYKLFKRLDVGEAKKINDAFKQYN